MLPYVKMVSESFRFIALKMNSKLAYSIPNTLNKYVKRDKDQLDVLSNQGVIYKIFCEDCETNYVVTNEEKIKD